MTCQSVRPNALDVSASGGGAVGLDGGGRGDGGRNGGGRSRPSAAASLACRSATSCSRASIVGGGDAGGHGACGGEAMGVPQTPHSFVSTRSSKTPAFFVIPFRATLYCTDRHCYLERRLRLSRASAAQNRAVRIIREVAGTHRSSHRTIRPRAPLRSGAPRTTSRPPRPRSRAASVATMRRRQRHPSAAAPAPPAPRASPGPARPRR